MPPETEKTYKIGQAAEILGLEPYVLRFWEGEFPQIRAGRTPKGQRYYTDTDLMVIRRIKHLLYEEKMTLEGARRKLEQTSTWVDVLTEIKDELHSIHELLIPKK
ncbi:MAG TPA: MerR family transcriptional regulator [Desulfomicrobiaceae bacterium]|nr:MerR family transcriptional regulator [Desulfomicrobiaceae bacterium]